MQLDNLIKLPTIKPLLWLSRWTVLFDSRLYLLCKAAGAHCLSECVSPSLRLWAPCNFPKVPPNEKTTFGA